MRLGTRKRTFGHCSRARQPRCASNDIDGYHTARHAGLSPSCDLSTLQEPVVQVDGPIDTINPAGMGELPALGALVVKGAVVGSNPLCPVVKAGIHEQVFPPGSCLCPCRASGDDQYSAGNHLRRGAAGNKGCDQLRRNDSRCGICWLCFKAWMCLFLGSGIAEY